MGYLTKFDLKILFQAPPKPIKEEMIDALSKCTTDNQRMIVFEAFNGKKTIDAAYIINEVLSQYGLSDWIEEDTGNSIDRMKWYDWKRDLLEMSKKYPFVIFLLTGEGEENGDMWKAYFLNGKCQVANAIITYDEFDVKKLR